MKSVKLARQFVERINAGDIDGIVALMVPDHRFVDSLGREILGREDMKSAWVEYYRVVCADRRRHRGRMADLH